MLITARVVDTEKEAAVTDAKNQVKQQVKQQHQFMLSYPLHFKVSFHNSQEIGLMALC
ncbi:hypothetical protein [Alicyclobacillus ferrooxydans]|uniref:hypothetical protein n=1 Tax=Alicyclobacillus ferrooxydans TaxID=471514 RepID=UPI000AB15CB6|nr:hypothetical protein [Alicyclobacillus ferrooxydans]